MTAHLRAWNKRKAQNPERKVASRRPETLGVTPRPPSKKKDSLCKSRHGLDFPKRASAGGPFPHHSPD